MTQVRRTIATIGLALFSLNVYADISVKDYQSFVKDPESRIYGLLENYVDGLGTGAYWSNKKFSEIYGVPLYCPTDGRALTTQNYMDTLEKMVEKYGQDRKERIGNLLLIGLMEAYPCQ